MFNVYYSNQLDNLKAILVSILKDDPNPNPFDEEIILVQSSGMAQWLQLQIATDLGISGNIQFPYPTSFLWQQYRTLFPDLPKENIFAREIMVWHLMRIIPKHLDKAEFSALSNYLKSADQLKLYQLSVKVADLFDQYLVYRPHWLVEWENNQSEKVFNEIIQLNNFSQEKRKDIYDYIQWQSILWNELVDEIKSRTSELIFNTSHRAYLQQRYFEKLDNLTEQEKSLLPHRIFIFGISSLPPAQLAVLNKLSQYCTIHLFFTNPSEKFWGDNREDKIVEKIALGKHLSVEELEGLLDEQGNPLLALWGKQGKEFLNLLTEQEINDIDLYHRNEEINSLLDQIKNSILDFEAKTKLTYLKEDNSLQIHSCHSKMREIEVLHNQLLSLFEQNPELSPNDIIVMSADIDSYTPYINAVFGRYEYKDPRFIPFTVSDQKISQIDPVISSFLLLLTLKENIFSAEVMLDLLDIPSIREKYQLTQENVFQLRSWVDKVGIRSGLTKDNPEWKNYNSWENGLDRLLLGNSLKNENNAWQDILAFNESYGLSAEVVGYLAKFIDNLSAWHQFLQQSHTIEDWQSALLNLINEMYQDNEHSQGILAKLISEIDIISEQITQADFAQEIDSEIITQLFEQRLENERDNLTFLIGKVNFCTLLPMRAIPFKVVCLLGMNEGDFPRQQVINNFDLMQFSPRKGDRARRDDDRYLFLEALLSAQEVFYISYIGQSLINNSEKFPSILVSQLIDYIHNNLPDNEKGNFKAKLHSMSVFSPRNFIYDRAYNKEWLDIQKQAVQNQPFLTKLSTDKLEIPTSIELDDLIAYLQEPVRYFFNHHLGVLFPNDSESIDETEHFSLSGLEKFNLLNELLRVDEADRNLFFDKEKLKGNLPVNHFSMLSERDLIDNISSLKTAISFYLTQDSQLLEVDKYLIVGENKIRLLGYIPNQFNHEVVQWRVGKLRDKDIICSWIYFLILSLENEYKPFRFYYRDGKNVAYIDFKKIEKEQAEIILQQYVEGYLSSFTELKWAIANKIASYFEDQKETSDIEHCRNALFKMDDPYIQRILNQSAHLDYAGIHQRTSAWFNVMLEHLNYH